MAQVTQVLLWNTQHVCVWCPHNPPDTIPIIPIHFPLISPAAPMTDLFQLLWNSSALSCVQVSDRTRAVFSGKWSHSITWIWIIKYAVRSECLIQSIPGELNPTDEGGRQRAQSVWREHEQVSPRVHRSKRMKDYVQPISAHTICCIKKCPHRYNSVIMYVYYIVLLYPIKPLKNIYIIYKNLSSVLWLFVFVDFDFMESFSIGIHRKGHMFNFRHS